MEKKKKELTSIRHEKGFYTIKELAKMFGIGRSKIDDAINSKELRFISPNNRIRFIEFKDFENWMKNNDGGLFNE